jgi:transposase InsO family protein
MKSADFEKRLGAPCIQHRGPQFASQVMQAVLGALGVKSALSTAYHPQTNGATEQANQEIEQFLRAYVN